MRQWLMTVTEPTIAVIDGIALLVIVVGTFEALVKVARATIRPMTHAEARDAWLRYSRWLVAALTFQLAADILETSISTSWQTIGRVAAIAVVRTFLNYFLERDVEKEQRECAVAVPAQLPTRRREIVDS